MCWLLAILLAAPCLAADPPIRPPHFIDVTDEAGLGGLNAARVGFADLNGDGRPDAVIDRHRIFLNTLDPESPLGFRFVEVAGAGLPLPRPGDSVVFADLDSDGIPDAIFVRYLDINREGFEPPQDPARTAWLKGRGDGTFGEPRIIEAAKPATTAAIAVGDVNRDGRLDLYLGNWYTHYGQSLEAFTNDLLLQVSKDGGVGEQGGIQFVRKPLAEDAREFDEESDAAGRPTYGVMIAEVLQWAARAGPGQLLGGFIDAHGENHPVPPSRGPQLLELNYGRRANRLWSDPFWTQSPTPAAFDAAPLVGFDGDDIRHGRHPDWLEIVARRDARFDRPDEKPFRSHGNTFDLALGDIDNDGMFDLLLAEITHGWAGDSSDRTRLLKAESVKHDPTTRFTPSPHWLDRIPPIPPRDDWPDGWFPRWNQGDLFCELADFDNDGLLDVILSSGDYPDPAPYDQRLRIYRQKPDGSFEDVTAESGIDHIGSQQIALGDVNGDGRLDLLVGQSFTRFTPEMIAAAGGEPRLRLFLNQPPEGASPTPTRATSAITLTLIGDPNEGVNQEALGAIVHLHSDAPGRERFQSRQLIGIGGHAGKQHQFIVHFGLGAAQRADRIEIHWPAAAPRTTILRDVPPGHHTVRLADQPQE
jgi:hypothetical protein